MGQKEGAKGAGEKPPRREGKGTSGKRERSEETPETGVRTQKKTQKKSDRRRGHGRRDLGSKRKRITPSTCVERDIHRKRVDQAPEGPTRLLGYPVGGTESEVRGVDAGPFVSGRERPIRSGSVVWGDTVRPAGTL